MVKILDCTTRDGGHETNWVFSNDFVRNHIISLQKNNIDFFEIGYRNYFERNDKGSFFYCDKEFLKPFYEMKENLKIGVMTDTSRFSFDDFKNSENDYVDFVRIATHPERIKETLNIATELDNRGYKTIIQIMEIPNVKNEHYEILGNFNKKSIFECIYIADTYSQTKPENIKNYFEKLKNIGYKNISFHAHNKNGYALANTIEAIKLGAYSVDVTYRGIGGNLCSKELFDNLN